MSHENNEKKTETVKVKKLALRRESITVLNERDLDEVAGGVVDSGTVGSCTSECLRVRAV